MAEGCTGLLTVGETADIFWSGDKVFLTLPDGTREEVRITLVT